MDSKKPTIAELEAILDRGNPDHVQIRSDGSLSTEDAREHAERLQREVEAEYYAQAYRRVRGDLAAWLRAKADELDAPPGGTSPKAD